MKMEEPPKVLTYKEVIYWSPSAKALEGVKEVNGIITKAKKFLKHKSVKHKPTEKCFYIKPIKGYNKNTYTVRSRIDGELECSCQFYNTVSKNWDNPSCSHIQAVKFWLEIDRWNKKGGVTDESKKNYFSIDRGNKVQVVSY